MNGGRVEDVPALDLEGIARDIQAGRIADVGGDLVARGKSSLYEEPPGPTRGPKDYDFRKLASGRLIARGSSRSCGDWPVLRLRPSEGLST